MTDAVTAWLMRPRPARPPRGASLAPHASAALGAVCRATSATSAGTSDCERGSSGDLEGDERGETSGASFGDRLTTASSVCSRDTSASAGGADEEAEPDQDEDDAEVRTEAPRLSPSA